MKTLLALHVQVEESTENFQEVIDDRDNFSSPMKKALVLSAGEDLKRCILDIQKAAQRVKFTLDKESGVITSKQEALQIILSTSMDFFEIFRNMKHHILKHQAQGQLKKGLTQLLDWTSHLDYAEENARKLLRLSQKIMGQLTRLDSIVNGFNQEANEDDKANNA